MDKTLNVFILSAGLGERLKPVTDEIPKPLLPVLGRPALQRVIENVSVLPVDTIGINLYHKRDVIENWVKGTVFSERVVMFPEEYLLGTGGALKNAGSFLGQGNFLVHNADIISDIDLERLFEAHLSSGNLATLIVHDHPGLNSVVVDEMGHLVGLGNSSVTDSGPAKMLAFTGIAFYTPEFLQFLPEGVSSVVDAWLNAVSAGYRIGTYDVSGSYWSDIGSPSAYAAAVLDALRAEGETIYIDPISKDCADASMDGYVVVEGDVLFGKGVALRNCVLLPGSRLEDGKGYENCILGPGFKIDLDDPFNSGLFGEKKALPIGTGGSDRRYLRVKRGNSTAVLMRCGDDDPDYRRQIDLTVFFSGQNVPVPQLLEDMPDDTSALFEDMGDLSLYSWFKCARSDEEVMSMYRRVIDMLVLIHSIPFERLSECPPVKERVLGYEALLWESAYFIERYVEGVINFEIKDYPGLESEFSALAKKVSTFPKTVIHRDFQSQNIMITGDRSPRLIDYQGARMGPPAYDLASILWDPYHRLTDFCREELINYYIEMMEDRCRGEFISDNFRKTILPCRLQRHMQALGAYGFLSTVKNKRYFLKYVPEGLRLLKKDISFSAEEYTALNDLVMRL
jgi:NDP-sugar pyrophosphorylase family protein